MTDKTGQSSDGMDRFEEREEQTFVKRHGHVNEVTVGTVLEYDDWQWALVTELAVDREEPKLGFILLDEVGDHIVQQLETANGCRQHYEVVEHLCGGEHEYWASVEYVLENDIWSVLGPVHPEFRSGENEKELVTDGGKVEEDSERVTGQLLDAEAEALVAEFNDAAPDYAPDLEWFAMSTDRNTEQQYFVFEAAGYIESQGLAALREAGRVVHGIEAYQKPPSDDVYCQMEIPVRGDGGRSLSPATDRTEVSE